MQLKGVIQKPVWLWRGLTLFLSSAGLALSLWHLSLHLSSETTLLGSLILRAQASLGISLGNSEVSPQQRTMITTTTTTTTTHSWPTSLWPVAVEEGVTSPSHVKANLLSLPTPAGYRMETWNKRKSHPTHCSSPNQPPLTPAEFSGQNC